MRKSVILLIILTILLCICDLKAQKLRESEYTLELLAEGAISPILRKAVVFSDGDLLFISISYPDGMKKTELIHTNSEEFKFQISEIQNGGLVNLQFIGNGDLSELILGDFNATVDGVPAKNLSGSFKLKKNQFQEQMINQLGGHIGIVHSLFVLQGGEVTGILDSDYEYSAGFPMGITIKKSNSFAFDIEIVPIITFKNSEVKYEKIDLLIHPGFLWGVTNTLTFGTRFAFELGEFGRYGITPLLNLGDIFPNSFAELVIPVRFSRDQDMSFAMGIHFGIGF